MVSSRTLAGRELTVPDGLDGPTLLLVAFRQEQQRDVDTWIAAVPDGAGVSLLEVPVLARRWRPARRFIDGGMASNMDQRTREQTMCRDVLGSSSTDVHALLVDADGRVEWRTTGPATAAGVTALTAAIDRLDRGATPEA